MAPNLRLKLVHSPYLRPGARLFFKAWRKNKKTMLGSRRARTSKNGHRIRRSFSDDDEPIETLSQDVARMEVESPGSPFQGQGRPGSPFHGQGRPGSPFQDPPTGESNLNPSSLWYEPAEDARDDVYSSGSEPDSSDSSSSLDDSSSDESRTSLSDYSSGDSDDDSDDDKESRDSASSPSRREVDSASSEDDYSSSSENDDQSEGEDDDQSEGEDDKGAAKNTNAEARHDSESYDDSNDSESYDSDSSSEDSSARSDSDSDTSDDESRNNRSESSDESDVSADVHFTEDFLNRSLKEKGVDRFDFDITAFLLYVQDLAGCCHADDQVDAVAFRVARYINSSTPGNPMGDDIERTAAGINALADLIGSCDEMNTLAKVVRVAAKVDGGLPSDVEPSTQALAYAIPIVLAHAETPLNDVAAIISTVYPFLPALQVSKTANAAVFPLAETSQVEEIMEALKAGDEASAIKLYQSFRLQPSAKHLPIGLTMDLDVFETRLRGLESAGLAKVCATIPIDGEAVEGAFDEDVIDEQCDATCEAFVRGAPLAVTIDDVPNSESAFAHLFGDEDSDEE